MNGKQAGERKLNEQLRNFFANRVVEKATPEYFETMLGQVHRRLRQELVGRPRWWDRFAELFPLPVSDMRPLLVRYALPLVLFGSAAILALHHDHSASKVAFSTGGTSSLAEAASPAHWFTANQDLLRDPRGTIEPSIITPTTAPGASRASGPRGELTTKAKGRENGERSFVSVLPVRYEASVDF
ncbi:hypothetical protein [Verrucomicrobium sp. 3C]|uniref:hypothetical protein n=1 Tax=Verrucomicrobium sp. 3C TaxID=1134055 RepID=UPI00037C09F1|nr:hypothetical protein [Verrucomicrobium sp. 3C]